VAPGAITQLTWLALAAVLAPVITSMLRRFSIPGVVLELLLGIVLGPVVLGWISPTGVVLDISNFGLALLMFLAGFEIDLRVIRGDPLVKAASSWGGSLIIGGIVALVLVVAGHRHGEVVIGLSLCTTALGTLLPVLRDANAVETPFGRYMLAVGSIGEFGPIILIALLLGGSYPLLTVALLLAFALLAVAFGFVASRPWGRPVTERLRHGLHSSSQLPVRLCILLLVALELLATKLGLDVLLGAFAAGLIVRVSLTGREDTEETAVFRGKLEAIGFGLFVPAFFITSGAGLDLNSFTKHRAALTAIPLFFALLLVTRGLPALIVYRQVLPPRPRWSLALLSATGLPLIVVVTAIGTANHYIAPQTAAALVTAGMLSVLILPAIGIRLLGSHRSATEVSGEL
jgi:Kef-type K+ transport system membrane component KefB